MVIFGVQFTFSVNKLHKWAFGFNLSGYKLLWFVFWKRQITITWIKINEVK